MPKLIAPLNDFSAGLNTSVNIRDIGDQEFIKGENVDSAIKGRLRCVGQWNVLSLPDYTAGPVKKFGSIIAAGSDYTAGNNRATTNNGSGVDLTVDITTTIGGVVSSVTVNNAGYGYEVGDVITISEVEEHTNCTIPVASFEPQGEGSVNIIDDFPVNAGYGLHAFNVDKDTSKADITGGGKYMAIFKPDGSSPAVSFFVDPEVSNSNYVSNMINLSSSGVVGSGAADVNTKIDYQFIDGSLTVFSRDLEFDPQKLYYNEAGKYYFVHDKDFSNNSVHGHQGNHVEYNTTTYHSSTNQAGTSREGYTQDKQFVIAPSGGSVWKSSDSTPGGDIGSLSSAGTEVGLLIHRYDQTGNDFQGWGRTKTDEQSYSFYATFVYDGNNESLPIKLGSKGLGGYESGDIDNDASFSAIVRPRASNSGAITWNDRITSVRIYFRKGEADEDIKYFIGDYPTSTFDIEEEVCLVGSTGHVALKGDKTGKGNDAFSGVGVYHKSPPTIFTHAVKSGIRPGTVSLECRYKTSVLLNRKLYVGNIEQKTKSSPNIAKKYPDRLLKSIANRFDVLPDSEFVDVAVRDGESIIKLASFGGRLLQFKEHTLYVIATAGGEEYLEATYHHRGVSHPNAVTVLPEGVFWVNEFGAFIFSGEGAPQNLIDNKIDNNDWATFITANAITGYYPIEKRLMVVGNAGTLLDATASTEIYYFNLLTGSWNEQKDILTEADTDRQKITNFVNYVDKGDNMHTLFMCNGKTGTNPPEDDADIIEYQNIDELSTVSAIPFLFNTKDMTAGVPAQRKKIYGLYITYKGNVGDNTTPTVKLKLMHSDSNASQTITLAGKTTSVDFENASDWQTAHYVVQSGDKSKVRNVYGVQVEIASTSCSNNFMINDMSLIYTLKTIK